MFTFILFCVLWGSRICVWLMSFNLKFFCYHFFFFSFFQMFHLLPSFFWYFNYLCFIFWNCPIVLGVLICFCFPFFFFPLLQSSLGSLHWPNFKFTASFLSVLSYWWFHQRHSSFLLVCFWFLVYFSDSFSEYSTMCSCRLSTFPIRILKYSWKLFQIPCLIHTQIWFWYLLCYYRLFFSFFLNHALPFVVESL